MPLPRSSSFALWLAAALRGATGPSEFADATRGDDPRHLIIDWPGGPEGDAPAAFDLAELPGHLRAWATREGLGNQLTVALALPAPGDPLGLAGPPEFNQAALQVGSAVLLGAQPSTPGVGLIPEIDARTVLWRARGAQLPHPLDLGEADRRLRAELQAATERLVRLDVASWQPEIPDLLLNLGHRDGPAAPPGVSARALETLDRASLCLEICELALADEGGALSLSEANGRRGALRDLEAAARRALAAACSDSLAWS